MFGRIRQLWGLYWEKRSVQRLGRSAVLVVAIFASTSLAQPEVEAPFREITTIDAPEGDVQQLACLSDGTLAIRTPYVITVVRPTGVAVVPAQEAISLFTDIDFSPDGRYLFAADWGRDQVRINDVRGIHAVHRFSVADGQWEVARLPESDSLMAYKVEALSGLRFVLHGESAQTLNMMEWGQPPRLISASVSLRADYVYDARRERLWATSSGLSPRSVYELLVGERLVAQLAYISSVDVTPRNPEHVVLSTDGAHLYVTALQFNLSYPIVEQVRDGRYSRHARLFPEVVYAATQHFAFGENGYYSAVTGERLGSLPCASRVMAVSENGTSLWVHDAQTRQLRQFELGMRDADRAVESASVSPFAMLDGFIRDVAAGRVDEIVEKRFDALAAARLYFGTELDGLASGDRRSLEVSMRRILHEFLYDSEVRRIHGVGVVTHVSMRHNRNADYSIEYRLQLPDMVAVSQCTTTYRRDDAMRWQLVDVKVGTNSLGAFAMRDRTKAGGSFVEWARGEQARTGRQPAAPVAAQQPAVPAVPFEVAGETALGAATWFRSRLEAGDVNAVVDAFSVSLASEAMFDAAWRRISDDERKRAMERLVLSLGDWLMPVSGSKSEIVGASERRQGEHRSIRYTVKVDSKPPASEQLLVVSTPQGWRLVDATVDGDWLLRRRAASFRTANVSPLRFARMGFIGPDEPYTVDASPMSAPDRTTPEATIEGFHKLLQAARVREAFESCVNGAGMLELVFGGKAISTYSGDEVARLVVTLSEILFPHADGYEISQLRRARFDGPKPAIPGAGNSYVASQIVDGDDEEATSVMYWLRQDDAAGWLIVEMRIDGWAGASGWLSQDLGRRYHASGLTLHEFLEGVGGR